MLAGKSRSLLCLPALTAAMLLAVVAVASAGAPRTVRLTLPAHAVAGAPATFRGSAPQRLHATAVRLEQRLAHRWRSRAVAGVARTGRFRLRWPVPAGSRSA